MKEILYFNTLKEINPFELEFFLSKALNTTNFSWGTDFYELLEKEIGKGDVYISYAYSPEDRLYYYSVFTETATEMSLRQMIDVVRALAVEVKTEILVSDDEAAPFTWVLLEPDGQASTVTITEEPEDIAGKEASVMMQTYNFPLGAFRTTHRISEAREGILYGLLHEIYAKVELEYYSDGPIRNGIFDRVKEGWESLKHFDHHYVIRPLGKNTWRDKEEQSVLFIQLMEEYRGLTGMELCLFPRNYSEVKNIEGGSDSEEHCILLTLAGQKKVVYKERRKSWKQ